MLNEVKDILWDDNAIIFIKKKNHPCWRINKRHQQMNKISGPRQRKETFGLYNNGEMCAAKMIEVKMSSFDT